MTRLSLFNLFVRLARSLQLPLLSALLALSVLIAIAPSKVSAQTVTQSANAPQQSSPAQWDDRAVYAFLAAELLFLDGNFEQAALALWPVARQLKQVELYERVTLWSLQAKRYDILFSAASAWEQQDPAAKPPKNFLEFLLIALRLDRMEQLRKAGKPDEAREQLLSAFASRSKIVSAETALLLAEQLEDDYQLPQAFATYELAYSWAESNEQKNMALAKAFAIKAKAGEKSALSNLLETQRASKGAHKELITNVTLVVLRDIEQYQQALELIKSLASDQQNYENALTYDMMGQHEKAEVLLRDALKNTPRAAHLLNTLGYSLVDRNPSPAALAEGTTLLEAAYKAAPNSNAIMDSLGWAYFRNKDYDKAQTLLQKSYDLKRDPEVAAHLGELFFVTGRQAQARNLWAAALALEPKHKVLNSTLKRFGVTAP